MGALRDARPHGPREGGMLRARGPGSPPRRDAEVPSLPPAGGGPMRALCTFLTCACALLLVVLTGCGEDQGSTPMAKASGFNGRFRAPGKDLLVLAERGDAVDLTMNGETVT